MHATVTIKLQAESKDELIDRFGSEVRNARDFWEGLRTQGTFGPPESVELRYLVIGGSWRETPSEEQAAAQP